MFLNSNDFSELAKLQRNIQKEPRQIGRIPSDFQNVQRKIQYLWIKHWIKNNKKLLKEQPQL